MEDVNEFCEKNTWLCEINNFCVSWNSSRLAELADVPVYVLEVFLSAISEAF